MKNINPSFYSATATHVWTGRNDGTAADVQRWHQRIQIIDVLNKEIPICQPNQPGVALIGFACDEGVRRNGGRIGAKAAPLAFRKACGNLPVHFEEELLLIDLGDITCDTQSTELPTYHPHEQAPNQALEQAQENLALLVKLALGKGYQPLVIGGGHEVTYGHYCGINSYIPADQSLGIINFDAHFDLREPITNNTNSGTGFFEIARDFQNSNKQFHYLPLGIQKNSNTKQLFDRAAALQVNYVMATEFTPLKLAALLAKIEAFIAGCDHIYLTIDLDVFSAAVAPGVSAVGYCGIFPDTVFFSCLQLILRSSKLISVDIAEYNPSYDIDQHTAKLAAGLAFEIITKV